MKPVRSKKTSMNWEALLPEVDYQALMAQMPPCTHPRRKLKEWQNKGFLTRLKKGFYVLSSQVCDQVYSIEIVANLLYGPSYISLESALSYYQLIPERVEEITSVTTQKNKNFPTSIGRFTYTHLSAQLYPIGVGLQKTQDQRNFLIATPEKALMDIFTLRFPKSRKPTIKMVRAALEDDLRFSIQEFKANRELLNEMKPFYKNRTWNRLLIEILLES